MNKDVTFIQVDTRDYRNACIAVWQEGDKWHAIPCHTKRIAGIEAWQEGDCHTNEVLKDAIIDAMKSAGWHND
jgi:hypothetical protein